ncbi:MAG TPA: zinc ABC transporter substrate-binding protein [Thermomicrobiales bacterium]|nr:zinc ABC transporter substrate-binding protein [Thermomicrobiales bacterium]
MNRHVALLLTGMVLVLVAACGDDENSADAIGSRPIKVVATTGMIGDTVANVGGERVDVESLMGPGVDPHLYQASASDVNRLDDADIIFYNGLELEGRMTDIFVRLASSRPTVAVAGDVDPTLLREPPEFEGKYDPHVWFDVTLWVHVTRTIERELSELDPGSADLYKENADAYVAQLEELDAWVASEIQRIPEQTRVLVTAHDAFGYFGARYGMEVEGLQGISTASEAGAADVQDLARMIADRGIVAIFVETSVPQATIEAVQAAVRAHGGEVEIGGELYSDAMGSEGTPGGTYIGMIRHNVETIVTALAGP